MTDIIFSSTTQLADRIRAGDVSAVEVLEAHLSQVSRHNPTINAVVTMDIEQARKRAEEADAALRRGEIWGPLHGVPFTLKDAHATAGMRTTTGFPLLDHVPQADSTITARLKQAGGVLIGKTNVPVMLGDHQTSNPIFGRTNNPWNLGRTPGGSSGGAAAALAAGMTPFEIGTDLSASIRLPAHFCGVFGLKPTENRVPITGLIPGLTTPRSIRIMSTIGPMARSVEDLALLYRIIAGPDGRDTEVQPVPVEDIEELQLKDLRIAFAPTFWRLPVARDIHQALEKLVAQLRPLCAAIEEVPLPEMESNSEPPPMGELIGMMLGAFQQGEGENPVPLARYLEALQRRDQTMIAWEQFFQDWDVLLSPASMVTAFPHTERESIQVDDQEVPYGMEAAHGTLFNYTGHPAIVMPYTLDRDGLPIGLQIVGRRWCESHLLGAAQALSVVAGGFQRPPGY